MKKSTKNEVKSIIDTVAIILTVIAAGYGLYLLDPIRSFLFMLGLTSRQPIMVKQIATEPSTSSFLIFIILGAAVMYVVWNRLLEKK